MAIRQTPLFLNTISKLTKKKFRDLYGNTVLDVEQLFSGLENPADIMKIGDVLMDVQDGDTKVLLKVRIPNSSMREGTSGGFRLICFFDKSTNETILLFIYPKKGKLGSNNISKDDSEAAILDYIEAVSNNSLIEFELPEE